MELTEEAKRSYEEFNQFLREFQDVYDAAALKLGISQSAFDVLWALCECGEGCLQRDICAYAYLGKQTVGSSVHKLVADGILHLEPAESGRGHTRVLYAAGQGVRREERDSAAAR